MAETNTEVHVDKQVSSCNKMFSIINQLADSEFNYWSIWVAYGCLYSLLFVWMAGCLAWQKLLYWTWYTNPSNKCVHTCHAYRQPPYILYQFQWPWPCWGSQGHCRTKLLGFIFSHTFELIWMKFNVAFKQFKLKILILLLLREICWIKRSSCCFTDCTNKF